VDPGDEIACDPEGDDALAVLCDIGREYCNGNAVRARLRVHGG
jgi:hypothetical protein